MCPDITEHTVMLYYLEDNRLPRLYRILNGSSTRNNVLMIRNSMTVLT